MAETGHKRTVGNLSVKVYSVTLTGNVKFLIFDLIFNIKEIKGVDRSVIHGKSSARITNLGGNMTEQIAYTLVSASFGFIAAICFCIGSSFLSKNKIVLLATTFWSYNEEQAKAIISQSAQYLTGALFLIAAFVFQVVATQASQATVQMLHPALECGYAFVIFVLVPSGIFAFCLFRVLILREKTILEELKKN
ncbi:hypothetical protein D8Y20_08490 [Mariprofundus sp. EBB-1]|uniref:hypothetical protein n=1 Tax=Mariprofundus sp. EBB-1 TaxID=2650971 RepID=UPI000EF27EBF|nr:hypothetical protein [Mariprofundus sp. EBB-1]RLL51717.1 hypothetical protein D8Y20_08490 [Mariprofundus sp. EBB-1]